MTDPKRSRGAGLAAVFPSHQADTPPSKEADKLENSHVSMPAKQQDGSVREDRKAIKATYYIDPALIKPLKFLSVEKERDLSSLVNEALRDLLVKHKYNSIRHCYSTT
ncbi:hypothetical protein M1B72_07335 [Geomonas paludis]|uniref:CopG family transcriptional regulator n=1 Tax=Geomonas paludis TaxID=2740185 RepID=A0ABY4LHQ7_9BACT|nr:hypothetical protein [Geomonas paludis]UPU37509.1 hypothetical protein M1B72_07335 [Geomonas paludis]